MKISIEGYGEVRVKDVKVDIEDIKKEFNLASARINK
jgi:hypothetical protein